MIRSNRRLTIREISEDLNISYGSVQNILTDLNMRRVGAKFIPHVLTVERKFLSHKNITAYYYYYNYYYFIYITFLCLWFRAS